MADRGTPAYDKIPLDTDNTGYALFFEICSECAVKKLICHSKRHYNELQSSNRQVELFDCAETITELRAVLQGRNSGKNYNIGNVEKMTTGSESPILEGNRNRYETGG